MDARPLRRNATEAEKRLWSRLRDRQLGGHKFRRQQSVCLYVADFCCWDARLVVEVDGGQHADNPRDDARPTWLQERGWQVLRFWNNEVLGNTDGVLQAILAALTPSP